MNLKPGCGTIIKKEVGQHKITLEFSSNVQESLKARKRFVELMIQNANSKSEAV